jgi:CDP-2,3-bis-(O-geranylgeranyl)-sn-glycerol synthase
MCPVIFAKLGLFKSLAKPIDGGRIMNGQPLFGANKSWRGLLAGIIGGLIISGIQAILFRTSPFFQDLSLFDYRPIWIYFGILAGTGAIIGDLIKSFFKRRVNIKAGDSWPIFDQLDFIFGFFIFTFFIFWPGWSVFIIVCLITLILHPLTNIISYLIGWKKVWW